jgi:hypothetical protein
VSLTTTCTAVGWFLLLSTPADPKQHADRRFIVC